MLKKQILYFIMLASVTTILADGFGGGFATGAITGWGISTIANSANKNYDPVAAEEARSIRQERLNEQRERREEQKRIRTMKKQLKQLEVKRDKAEKKHDNKTVAKLETQIEKLQDKIDDAEAGL